ncbi:binding--dependent transport system inner membrane component family protein, partial [Vibrio parahaemolyticus V-223/04]
IPKPIQQP